MNFIVGIDPGTTTGFAVFDLQGKLVKAGSEKELGKDQLVWLLSEIGSPLIIGSDKRKIPGFVESVASQFGSVIHAPDNDVLAKEKRELVRGLTLNNSHEIDAAASALLAYRAFSQLVERTKRKLQEEGKEFLFDQVIVLVIKHKLSIAGALVAVEQPTLPRVQALKKLLHVPLPKSVELVRLFEDAVLFERANTLLKQKLKECQDQLLKSNKRISQLYKSVDEFSEKKAGVLLRQKDERIYQLRNERARVANMLQKENQSILALLKRLTSKTVRVVPRVSTLSKKNFFDELIPGSILFVDNPNVLSHDSRVLLKSFTAIMCVVSPLKQVSQQLPIPCIISDGRYVFLYKNWACIDEKWLEKKLKEDSVLFKLVQEYKKERENNARHK